MLAAWVLVGGELCALPLDCRGDPPLVANSVKNEMRLHAGADKCLLKWFEPWFSGTLVLGLKTPPHHLLRSSRQIG